MILDKRSEFSSGAAVATATGLALFGDVMDLGTARNIGNGRQMFLVVAVTTPVTSAGAATLQVQLVSDAQAAIAVDGTATVHAISPAVGKAALVAGYRFVIPVPTEGDNPYERYLGVLTNVGTAALTAGAVKAFLVFDANESKAYADAEN